MTRIKICGITDIDDALAAASLGADAIGLVFAESPRRIELETARAISYALPPLVGKVGVFVNESAETIRKTAEFCHLTAVQLHGDEPSSLIKSIGIPAIKAFRVHDESVLERISRYGVPSFLLDTFNGRRAGGTGVSFDWEIARMAKACGNVILAGGLSADNIEDALNIVRPYAVDVSSGVEKSPGRKDIRKVELFIKKVRQWDYRTD